MYVIYVVYLVYVLYVKYENNMLYVQNVKCNTMCKIQGWIYLLASTNWINWTNFVFTGLLIISTRKF